MIGRQTRLDVSCSLSFRKYAFSLLICFSFLSRRLYTPRYLSCSSSTPRPSSPSSSSTQGPQAPPRRAGSARGSSGGKKTGTAVRLWKARRSSNACTTSGRWADTSQRSYGSPLMLNSQMFWLAVVLEAEEEVKVRSKSHQRPGRLLSVWGERERARRVIISGVAYRC